MELVDRSVDFVHNGACLFYRFMPVEMCVLFVVLQASRGMLDMIRLILVALALLLYFIITLPLYLVLLLIGTKRPDIRAKIGQKSVKWGFKVILAMAGVKVKVKGLENIPKEAVLFVGNHRSFFDIPVVYSTVPLQTGFVSKMQVKKVPFLSWWMTCINCLFLDRQDVKQAMQMILAGIEHIKKGTSICIMPEGTRNYEDEMLPFKEGSFKMAEKTGCPIIPIAMWKNDDIFEAQFPRIKAKTVTVYYGEPIRIEELSKEEKKRVGVLVRSKIEEMLTEIRG